MLSLQNAVDNKGFVATPLKKNQANGHSDVKEFYCQQKHMKNGLVPERSTHWNNLENDKPLQPLNWSPKSDLFIILRQVKPGYPNCSVAKYETRK